MMTDRCSTRRSRRVSARPSVPPTRRDLAAGRIHSARGFQTSMGSLRRVRRGESLRWMPEYTQFSTLDTRYDDDD